MSTTGSGISAAYCSELRYEQLLSTKQQIEYSNKFDLFSDLGGLDKKKSSKFFCKQWSCSFLPCSAFAGWGTLTLASHPLEVKPILRTSVYQCIVILILSIVSYLIKSAIKPQGALSICTQEGKSDIVGSEHCDK